MTDPRYERAKALHRQSRLLEAREILSSLVADEPDNIAARYALAISLIDLGQPDDAINHLAAVLDGYPSHYEAAYRMGCLLQAAGRRGEAAEAYRKVLAVQDFRDTAARLAACQANGSASVPMAATPPQPRSSTDPVMSGDVLPPGVAPLRRMMESANTAHPGAVQRTCHLQARFLAPWVVGALALAIALPLVPGWITALVAHYGAPAMAGDVASFFSIPLVGDLWGLATTLTWLVGVPVSLASMLMQSRFNRVEFRDHGMDVSMGVIRRSHQVIWYYQIAEAPIAARGPQEYLTGTTTLKITYNVTATATQTISLEGIGSPAQVSDIRSFLQSRVPPERWVIKGPWT